MATGNTYIRGLCIVLNILLGISGLILLLFGIVASSVTSGHVQNWADVVFLSVGFGLATILLSILGVYGAYREHVLALLSYSIFMAIEFIALMVLAIMKTLAQPKEDGDFEKIFNNTVPLYAVDDVLQRELNKLQQQAQCCGLTHYTDWRDVIPSSCFCHLGDPERETKCVIHNETRSPGSAPLYVYASSCGPIIIEYGKKHTRIMLGIIFTLATVKVAALIVALLLCYKIYNRSQVTGLSQDNNSRIKYELQPDNTA